MKAKIKKWFSRASLTFLILVFVSLFVIATLIYFELILNKEEYFKQISGL